MSMIQTYNAKKMKRNTFAVTIKKTGVLMRKMLFLMCVLGLPCALSAQPSQVPWANLSTLRAGQSIQVVDINAKKHSGIFVSVSDTAISYRETSSEHSIQKQDVRSVKIVDNKHRGHNVLVGLAVGGGAGAGVGAIIGVATYKGCPSQGFCLDIVSRGDQAAIAAVIGFAGGAITGAVVGALSPAHSTLYSVSSH
jgi:hypothetical protein